MFKTLKKPLRGSTINYSLKRDIKECPICGGAYLASHECPQCRELSHKCIEEMVKQYYVTNALF